MIILCLSSFSKTLSSFFLESRVMLCMYTWYFKRCTLYKFIEINYVLFCSVLFILSSRVLNVMPYWFALYTSHVNYNYPVAFTCLLTLAGFIPRSEHYFGKRYAVNCKGAISDFEFDHRKHQMNADELRLSEAVQSGKLDRKAVPNLPVSDDSVYLYFAEVRSSD